MAFSLHTIGVVKNVRNRNDKKGEDLMREVNQFYNCLTSPVRKALYIYIRYVYNILGAKSINSEVIYTLISDLLKECCGKDRIVCITKRDIKQNEKQIINKINDIMSKRDRRSIYKYKKDNDIDIDELLCRKAEKEFEERHIGISRMRNSADVIDDYISLDDLDKILSAGEDIDELY